MDEVEWCGCWLLWLELEFTLRGERAPGGLGAGPGLRKELSL